MTRADFRAVKGGPQHMQEVVNIPREVEGVEVAALFYEPPKSRTTKVSLRGKGGINVRAVAAKFGGGGHRQAAGCELNMPLPAASRLVLAEIRKRLGK